MYSLPTPRLVQIIKAQLLLVAAFCLILLLSPAVVAATLPTPSLTTAVVVTEKAENAAPSLTSPDGSRRYRRSEGNANFWRLRGQRSAVRRAGVLGWILPARSRHDMVEKQRSGQRAATRAHYAHKAKTRSRSNQSFWQSIGFAE